MSFEIALNPAGHLLIREIESDISETTRRGLKKSLDAFSQSPATGLFYLAANSAPATLNPSLAFWRDFGSLFITALCRGVEQDDRLPEATEPPGQAQLAAILLNAPPMQGGEYLSIPCLARLWNAMDRWVQTAVEADGGGFSKWLRQHAPAWHQVGRVCFHLAENKRDPSYPFAFLATYTARLSKQGKVQHQPLSKALEEYAGTRNKKALVQLLGPVHRASERSAFVKDLVDSGEVFHPLAWTAQEAYRFLKEIPLFETSGITTRLPDWWRRRVRPRVSVSIGANPKNRLGSDAILDFNLKVALGDESLSDTDWERLMQSDDGLVFLKGQWVEVDKQKLTEALEQWKRVESQASEGGLTFIEGMRMLAGAPPGLTPDPGASQGAADWSYVNAGGGLSDLLKQLRDPANLTDITPGKAFRGTLRPYQKTGLNWLNLLTRLGLGACLADDMGLGKTIQMLSLFLVQKQGVHPPQKPSLLIMPASLLGNWKSEIERFTPSLKVVTVHPSQCDRSRLERLAAQPREGLKNVDIVLTTYGMVARQSWLKTLDWRLIVLDEAQAIKNPGARQTRAVKALKGNARVALTGTPVENRLSDLWSLFDFLCPGLLGSAAKFKQFTRALEQRERAGFAPLRRLVRPYILRRLKTDKSIISDLPDKTEFKTYCNLVKRQAGLYAKTVQALATDLKTASGIKRRGLVLAYLTRFKQICNHPSQSQGDGEYKPAESGKFGRLRALCEEIASRQEKVLVFTQFREMTEPLMDQLTAIFGRPGLVLHGGTPVRQRKQLVDSFQRENGPPFFVLSLKAGGTGLNLTAASHVIHFDRWWNPAVENQATDRAFRIGQRQKVLVHKFICSGTVEEKIDRLIEEKTALSKDLLEGGGETLLTEMNDDDLIALVSLDVNQISE